VPKAYFYPNPHEKRRPLLDNAKECRGPHTILEIAYSEDNKKLGDFY